LYSFQYSTTGTKNHTVPPESEVLLAELSSPVLWHRLYIPVHPCSWNTPSGSPDDQSHDI